VCTAGVRVFVVLDWDWDFLKTAKKLERDLTWDVGFGDDEVEEDLGGVLCLGGGLSEVAESRGLRQR